LDLLPPTAGAGAGAGAVGRTIRCFIFVNFMSKLLRKSAGSNPSLLVYESTNSLPFENV
jgi:hypothetical protein